MSPRPQVAFLPSARLDVSSRATSLHWSVKDEEGAMNELLADAQRSPVKTRIAKMDISTASDQDHEKMGYLSLRAAGFRWVC